MREISYSMHGAIVQGLRTFDDLAPGAAGCFDVYNLKCSARGLRDWHTPSAALSNAELVASSLSISAPFPQIFHGRSITLVVDSDKIFQLDKSNWTLTRLHVYDGYNPDLEIVLTPNGVWDFVDFGSSWMLFNGTMWVYKTANESIFTGGPDKIYAVTTPAVTTACKFKGRAVYAGFSGNVWNTTWLAVWQSLLKTDTGIPFQMNDLGANHVWWSTVGGGDLLWLIYPQLALGGVLNLPYNENVPPFIAAMHRKDNGIGVTDSQGAIMRIAPIGNILYIFTEDGCDKFVWIPEMLEFAKQSLDICGLAVRGAVCSSDSLMVFVDANKELWIATPDGGMAKRGYKEYMTDLLASGTFNIHYDKFENDFYLTGGGRCFIYNQYGLTEIGRNVTGVVNWQGSHVGTFEELGNGGAEDTQLSLVTHTIDIGTRSQKTIVQLEVALTTTSAQQVQVAIDYRYTKDAVFARTAFVPVNNEGFASITVSGLEFRLVVVAANYKGSVLTDIRYSVQFDDVRNRYGIAAKSGRTEQLDDN